MKPEKLQNIFIHCLRTALKDARWRCLIRAQLIESELPVIDLVNHEGDVPATLARQPLREEVSHIQNVREELVINFSN